jgi:hypothetical protein
MKLIAASEPDFEEYWRTLQSCDAWGHPFLSREDILYQRAYFENIVFTDVSRIVLDHAKKPIAGLRMAISKKPDGPTELNGFGRAIVYLENNEPTSEGIHEAGNILRCELAQLLRVHRIEKCKFVETRPYLTPVAQELIDAGAETQPVFTQILDLRFPIADLRAQVRKSYKSLINWGAKNLTIAVRGAGDGAAVKDFADFKELHREASGRVTRTDRTWLIQEEAVRLGTAFFVGGRLDGILVTAALFMCSATYCYYGVSASKRELFEKPLGHAILWNAIVQAKERGCHWFETGEQLIPRTRANSSSEKERGISSFKKGFGGKTFTRLALELDRLEVSA